MAPTKSFYETLGVSSMATLEEIKKAYRTASLAHHPDRHGGSNEKMQEINHAYDILSDLKKRQEYDDTGLDPTLHPAAAASGSSQKSGGYCAGCSDDPCKCFKFKPAGSSRPSNAPKPSPRCFECHRDIKDLRHVQLSCGCCYVCSNCANHLFNTPPHKPRRRPHLNIELTFEEVKDMLASDIWQKCNLARQPICYICKTPNATCVTGLCKVHHWCRTCFIAIYSNATDNPRCCDKMVNHSTLREHLPHPVLALYEMRQASGFRPWRRQDQHERLMRELKDWQSKNGNLIFNDPAREVLEQKDARIKDLEAQLKAAQDPKPDKAENEAPTPPDSELKDELVRRQMRIAELERSNKILKDSITREQAKFAEAGKARKIAVDNEAALRYHNEELKTQLAAAHPNAEQPHHAPSASRSRGNSRGGRGRYRNDILDDLSAAQEAHKVASNANDACQKRVKDLEAEVLKLRQEIEEHQQATAYNQKQTRLQLTSAKASEKIAIHNNGVAQQKIKDLEAQIAQSQNQVKALKDRQSELHEEVVAAQVAEKTAVGNEATARKQLEELKTQLSNNEVKDASAQALISELYDQIASLKTQLAASQQSAKCQHCESSNRNRGEAESFKKPDISSSASSQDKPSQGEARVDTSDSSPAQQAAAPTNEKTKNIIEDNGDNAETSEPLANPRVSQQTAGDTPKSDSNVSAVTPDDKAIDKSETARPAHVDSEATPPSDAATTPETPMSLLKAKLHYARSLQYAAENNAMLALDETLDLKVQLRKHQKFEAEAKKEFAKANKMYSSLQQKYKRAMEQLQRFQEQKNGAVKIPASHFVHDVDDHSKSVTDALLLKLNEQFEPVKTQIRKSQAQKSKKTPEPALKIAARRNRRLRDIIREREQEIANVRIDYGNKWNKVIAGIADRDSEIRALKRQLGIRESRSNGDASVDATRLREKDEFIHFLMGKAVHWRMENRQKEKTIELLNAYAKTMEQMKKKTAKLYADLNTRFVLENQVNRAMKDHSSTWNENGS